MAENGWVVLTAATVETLSREGENPLAYLVRHRQVVKVDPRFSTHQERGTFADGSRYSHFRTARGTCAARSRHPTPPRPTKPSNNVSR